MLSLFVANLIGADPPACPAFKGWFVAGCFDALDVVQEPWHGSRRRPTSAHATSFVRQVLPSSVLASDTTCTAGGADRCFTWEPELFHGVTSDRHIKQMPKVEPARVLPPESHLIMIELSPEKARAFGAKYRMALLVKAWLERGANVWPTDQSPSGWAREDLRWFVRPMALRLLWMCMHIPLMAGHGEPRRGVHRAGDARGVTHAVVLCGGLATRSRSHACP